jgi:hypothetical protein
MASWIVNVLVDKHSPGGEWSRQNRLLMYHGQLFSWGIAWTGRMVQDSYSPGALPRQVEWFVSLSSQ